MPSPSKPQKLVLFINHNIFLTKEERYSLVNGTRVETTGVSSPVWMEFSNGKTTEPCEEVFCKYRIDNDDQRKPTVRGLRNSDGIGNGYWINLPQLPEDWKELPDLDMEAIAELSEQERKRVFEMRDEWFAKNPTPPNGNFLLDHKEKGGEYLRFELKMSAKMTTPIADLSKMKILVSHLVEIKTFSRLEKSLV